MSKTILAFCRLITCLLATVSSFAQGSSINISLADETEETEILKSKEMQAETGILFNHFKGGPSAVIGQLFLRKAISSRVEFRLLVEDGKERDLYMEETVQSTYPLAAGAKWKLLADHPVLPDMTLAAYLGLPLTAHNKRQQGYWSPMVFMAFHHKLSDKWSLTYNAGGQQEAFGTSWSMLLNGSVHYKINDDLELFTEYFSQYEPGQSPNHNAGGGITYNLSKHFAVYATGGSTVKYDNPNYFMGAGAAIKFP